MLVEEQEMVKITSDSPVIMPHSLAHIIKIQETEHMKSLLLTRT